MKPIPLGVLFVVALCLTLFLPAWLPQVRLLPFVPFLAVVCLRSTRVRSLYTAIFCGAILDVCTCDTRMGAYATSLLIATFGAYPLRRYFLEEKFVGFTLYCWVLALFVTLFLALFAAASAPFAISLGWSATDMLLLPLADGIVGWVILVFPTRCWARIRKYGLALRRTRSTS